MFKKFLRKNTPSPSTGGDFEEGKRLFELGVAAAHRDNFIEAQQFYTQSIEACPNPVPYLNRGRILVKRLRHYDALNDYQNALRCDLAQGNEFVDEIQGEIQSVQFFTEFYRDGTREKLIADYDTQDDIMYVARRIFCTSFKVKADGFVPYNSPLVQFYFFNEIDNIARFDDLSLYPEVTEFLKVYPAAFVRKMVDTQIDDEAYMIAEATLHRFLCAYDEKRMRYLRRHMLYDIHERLLDRDYGAMGHGTMASEPNSHLIREAAEYLADGGS